jgi:site-specific DNA recombinase
MRSCAGLLLTHKYTKRNSQGALIKNDLYAKFSAKYKAERMEIGASLENVTIPTPNLEKYIERAIHFSTELTSLRDSSNYREKQRLQFMILPKGIYYHKKNDQPRTTKLNGIFSAITGLKQNTAKKKPELLKSFSKIPV